MLKASEYFAVFEANEHRVEFSHTTCKLTLDICVSLTYHFPEL